MKVFVHILTFNSEEWIVPCIKSVFAQDYPLTLLVTDNRSSDKTVYSIRNNFADKINIQENKENLGFAAGQNQGAAEFLKSNADIFLILNPDIVLNPNFISKIVDAFKKNQKIGAITGKLLRYENSKIIDSTGIIFTSSLRHLDRGAGEIDNGQYEKEEFVSGATGACLALSREFIKDVAFRAERDFDCTKIYAELADNINTRPQIFDEAFFAYREDADLAWRALILGWRFLYVPSAVALHGRRVTPEKRNLLPSEINAWSVRNRFLMQVNNFRWGKDFNTLFSGLIVRNLTVLFAILIKEHTSLVAIKQFFILLPRALARRRYLAKLSYNREQHGLF